MAWFSNINWFANHVKRFREAVVASSFAASGLEIFLPKVKVECFEPVTLKVGYKPLLVSDPVALFIAEIFLASSSTRGACPLTTLDINMFI